MTIDVKYTVVEYGCKTKRGELEMTVLNYMARQRDRLREKHNGETYLLGSDGEAVPVDARSVYDILGEIDAMRGLNTRERYSRGEYANA